MRPPEWDIGALAMEGREALAGRFHHKVVRLVTYAAMLDVPRPMVDYLACLRAAYRRLIGTSRGSRKLGPFRQAVFVLRWFREAGCVHCLARNRGISQATGYRYLHEGIDVLIIQRPRSC